MSTVGDLVNGNPFYDKGIFSDGNYYKEHIPQQRWDETAPSPADLKKALIQQSCLTIASNVLLIGCVLIPSIYTLGTSNAVYLILGSAACALMSRDLDRSDHGQGDITDTGLIPATQFKSKLLAALPKQEHNKYLLKEGGWETAIKTAFLAIIRFAPNSIAHSCSYVGVCIATYHFTVELEKLFLLCIKSYIQHSLAKQQLQPLGAPALT